MEMLATTTRPGGHPTAASPASFAAMLRRDRDEAGLSLEVLAHKVQTSPAYLFRLEKGTAANPGRNFTLRLGIALYRDDIDRIDLLLQAVGHLPLITSRAHGATAVAAG